MTRTFLFIIFFFLSGAALAQEKRMVYFLADTASIPQSKKVLEILLTPFHYTFMFYTDFKAPYYNWLEFSSLVDKGHPREKVVSQKPTQSYISLKELLELAKDSPNTFNDNYDLFITEVLPGKKYQTSKVKLIRQSAPTVDYHILKPTKN